MKNLKLLGFLVLTFTFTQPLSAQTRLVLNGASLNLTNGAYLVLENPEPTAIMHNSGQIISEGENNQIKWITGNTAGTFRVPFGQDGNNLIPLTFTKSAGIGNGYFLLATYGTGWQNSASLPNGITNLNGPTADNSTKVIDRFWKIAAVNYSTKPELLDLTFTYLPKELNAPNTITEEMLGTQRWNETTNSWAGFAPAGEVETTLKTVTIPSVSASEMFSWWTLVDRSSPLPLELLSFEARKAGRFVNLNWVTASEVNCDNFEIERSAVGSTFTNLGIKPAQGSQLNTYNFTDQSPLAGTAYYRLKQNNLDGTFKYSPIRSVITKESAQIIAFPNPTLNHKLQLVMGNAPSGLYTVLVSDLKGTQVFSSTKQIDAPNYSIQLPETVKAGIYLMTLQHEQFVTQFKIAIK